MYLFSFPSSTSKYKFGAARTSSLLDLGSAGEVAALLGRGVLSTVVGLSSGALNRKSPVMRKFEELYKLNDLLHHYSLLKKLAGS